MGALPKNKATRNEQGKRRRGNAPKLKKDVHLSRVPLHKQGFVNQLLQFVGLSPASAKRSAQPQTEKAEKKVTRTHASGPAASAAAKPAMAPAVKTTRKTQHKG